MLPKTLLVAFAMIAPALAQPWSYAYKIEVSDNRIVYHRGQEVRSGQSNIFQVQGPNIADGERGFLQIAPARTFDVSTNSTRICVFYPPGKIHAHHVHCPWTKAERGSAAWKVPLTLAPCPSSRSGPTSSVMQAETVCVSSARMGAEVAPPGFQICSAG